MRMNSLIIGRYIFRQIALGFAITAAILLGIAWFSQVIRLLGIIVSKNAPFLSFLKLTSYLLPDLLVVVSPVALFISTLFVYNRLVADKELIIMEGGGLSPRALALPALGAAGILAAVLMVFTLWLSPVLTAKYRAFAFEVSRDISSILVREGEFNLLSPGITIFVKSARGGVMGGIFIDDRRAGAAQRTIVAEKGRIESSAAGVIISLENGAVEEKSGSRHTFGRFSSYVADLGLIKSQESRDIKVWELPLSDLVFSRERGLSTPATERTFKAELHRRFIEPLYAIVLVLIALASIFLSSLNRRSGSRAPAIAVAAALFVKLASIALGRAMAGRPWGIPAAWGFVMVAALVAWSLISRERKAR